MSNKTQELDRLSDDYAKSFSDLNSKVESLNWEIEEIKVKHLGGIRAAVQEVKSHESKIERVIVENPELFAKPRTMTLHGIKLGLQKKKGTINFADNSIDLIKSKLDKHAPALIVTKESISKTYAQRLSVAEIKSIGGEVVADKDTVIIKSMDTNTDKLVKALIDSKDEEITL